MAGTHIWNLFAIRRYQRPVAAGGAATAPSRRLLPLDSVRGIAALIVVFNHYFQVIPGPTRELASYPGGLLNPGAWLTPWPWLRATPLRLLVDGEAAVDVFFVLSGFVLALGVTRGGQPRVWSFLISRLCRVYIPFAACLVLTAVAYSLAPIKINPDASQWFNNLVTASGNYSLLGHLLMTGHEPDMVLNHAMWTLVHEMRMSIFMPLIFLGIRRAGVVPTVAGCLIISIVASRGMTDSISGSWQATAHFCWMFAAGSALSFHRGQVIAMAGKFSTPRVAVMWVCAFALLALPFERVRADFAIGAGAILLVSLCLPGGRIADGLSASVPLWLGRVSYSLYLVHLPILIIARSGWMMTPVPSLLVTLVLAELAYRIIEAPAHELGKRLIAAGNRLRSAGS